MATLQASASLPLKTTKGLASDTNRTIEPNILEDMQLIAQLLDFGQVLCQKMQSGVSELCHEVKRITQDRAYLHIEYKRSRTWKNFSRNVIVIPVQFGYVSYGSLCITYTTLDTAVPSIPLPIAQLFAQTCSWLLHEFEQATFLQGQCQQFEYQVQGQLTKREREVLHLMYQGCNQEEIAHRLSIAPATLRKHRQHIYAQLGVHNERDAMMAAYYSGLLSPFEENL